MRTFVILPLLLLPTMALADQPCSFTAPQNMDLQLAGVHTLELDMGAADLRLDAAKDAGDVQVRGRACASSQKLLDTLRVTQHREGDRLIIKAEGNANWNISVFGSHYAYMKLQMHIPDNLPVVLHTGSGDAELHGVARAQVHSGSGDVKLTAIKGAVTVTTGSGDMVADDVGSLDVKSTGSGDLRARVVHGDVSVGHVGSGDLSMRDVDGVLTVDRVGSGDIELARIHGNVEIGSIGSGDVNADAIGGDFTVRSHGSGDINPRNVTGKVSVPRR